MSRKVMFTHPMVESGLAELLGKGYEVFCPKSKMTRQEILDMCTPYEAIVCPNFKVDREVIDRMPELKIICAFGAGYDNVDVASATEKNIVVANMTAVHEVTAEYGIALIAATMRNIAQINHDLRTIPNLPWGPIANLGHSMRGKVLGIIGMGRIGRGVAKRALAFGMKIIYHNRKSIGEELEVFLDGARLVGLEELLRSSDAVFINAPLTPETHHMISDKELAMMKPDAYIFNQGRGKIIDEQALIRCLRQGKLAGAGLDVFENEPSIPQELLEMRNVVVTAHMGTSTYEDKAAMVAAAGHNIIEFFEHFRFPHIVNPQVIATLPH